MTSAVYSGKFVSLLFSPPRDHALFPIRRISLNKSLNLSNLLGSLKCKSTTAADVMEPPIEPHQNIIERNVVSNTARVQPNRKRRPFWHREWLPLDYLRLGLLSVVHLMCLYAPFCFNWHAVKISAAIALITGVFGLTLSYHRQLSHKSFTLPKWLEYVFAYCGVQAFEGNPIDWVSTHRYHHKFADTEQDPHSPNIEGFWFSHFSWILDRHFLTSKCGKPTNVDDLRSQAFYKFLEKTYYFHSIGFGALLYAFGGLPLLVWGMGVRVVLVLHITFLLASACHIWGVQDWETGDLSRNNWLVGVIAFGDGWHNNHHAFQYSARHGIEWWQVDVTWGVIRLLELIGLATDVKRPSVAHKKRLRRRSMHGYSGYAESTDVPS